MTGARIMSVCGAAVRVFTYTGPRTAITALTEQFHP
jgi:hypothetical protein